MATCRDCLHYGVCVVVEHGGFRDEYFLSKFGCDSFKDKSQYAELAKGIVSEIPNIELVEVKRGEWIKPQFVGRCGFYTIKDFTCGECGESFEVGQGKGLMYYCPNCGAKMDGGNNG